MQIEIAPLVTVGFCLAVAALMGFSIVQGLALRATRMALILSILREHKGEWLFGLDFAEKSNNVLLFRPWLAQMLQTLEAEGWIESQNFPGTEARGGRPRRGYRIPVREHEAATAPI